MPPRPFDAMLVQPQRHGKCRGLCAAARVLHAEVNNTASVLLTTKECDAFSTQILRCRDVITLNVVIQLWEGLLPASRTGCFITVHFKLGLRIRMRAGRVLSEEVTAGQVRKHCFRITES